MERGINSTVRIPVSLRYVTTWVCIGEVAWPLVHSVMDGLNQLCGGR